MTCRCVPQSPFRWREWTSCTDLSDLERSTTMSIQSSNMVNSKRKQGRDIGNIEALSTRPGRVLRKPQSFTTDGLK